MIITKIGIRHVSLFGLTILYFSLLGCWSGSQIALPEAPPPYPNSPYPNGSQSDSYTPPASPDPRGNNFTRSQPSTFTTSRSYEKSYTLEAVGTIWVLVQDKLGNELQWLSLMSGDKTELKHTGPLTLTCSSGESLKIFAPDGKPVQVAGSKKGISIIRLP